MGAEAGFMLLLLLLMAAAEMGLKAYECLGGAGLLAESCLRAD